MLISDTVLGKANAKNIRLDGLMIKGECQVRTSKLSDRGKSFDPASSLIKQKGRARDGNISTRKRRERLRQSVVGHSLVTCTL